MDKSQNYGAMFFTLGVHTFTIDQSASLTDGPVFVLLV